jgi:GNAT superfamily N-acetyltransferase
MQRTLFMALRSEPDRPGRAGVCREVDRPTLHALEVRLASEDPPLGADAGFAERLVSAMDVLRAATPWRGFAAGENDELVSACTLFLDGDGGAALLDNVGTLRSHRRRGLARAVVSTAVARARAEGCELIVIPADADDWPKDLYARLGFAPLGVQVAFTLARAA